MANGMPTMNSAGMGELFARLRFVLIALLIYRVGTHIPVPGIDPEQLSALFDQNQGTILGLANVFSGGALERMSILALGILPYISASIIMNLMSAVSPQLEQIKKEGEAGRRKISQYTRYLTVALALVQATGMTVGLANQGLAFDTSVSFYVIAITSLVTGDVFMMWLGEQITERGVGNGISMLILVGILAGLPGAVSRTVGQVNSGAEAATTKTREVLHLGDRLRDDRRQRRTEREAGEAAILVVRHDVLDAVAVLGQFGRIGTNRVDAVVLGPRRWRNEHA